MRHAKFHALMPPPLRHFAAELFFAITIADAYLMLTVYARATITLHVTRHATISIILMSAAADAADIFASAAAYAAAAA